ncbi:hypothetical protein [Ewingella americana]
MYGTLEISKQSRLNHWYVRETDSDQPDNWSWREWWESKSLGQGHIKWRSTCIALNCPDPFKPVLGFKVDFAAPAGKTYQLEFTLVPTGANK